MERNYVYKGKLVLYPGKIQMCREGGQLIWFRARELAPDIMYRMI